MTKKISLFARLATLTCFLLQACKELPPVYFPDPDPAIQQRLEQWKDLKFGLLLHWGPYSQWGVVESWTICPEDLSFAAGGRKQGVADNYHDYVKQYEALKTTFNPQQFRPEKWAAAARQAGMKYVVFTTKHHDGFSMFDSRYTNYKVTDSACPFSSHPRANIAKEVFDAFRQQQFWIGAYFSKPDWHSDDYWWKKFPAVDRNPNYAIQKHPERWKRFTEFTHNQINELMTGYGKIDILWLDGGWVRKKPDADVQFEFNELYEGSRYSRNPQSQDIDMPGLVKNVRAKQPGILVVDRAVKGIHQNYLTPEQHIPETGLPYPWETCMTMGTSWSYKPGDIYKPTGELLQKLVDIVSKGGNYLLNIGPGPDGELDPVAYLRLQEIGAWLQQNGEAIYSTRMHKVFGEGEGVRYTRSKDGKTTYIFLFDFPAQPVRLKEVSFTSSTRLTLLGNQAPLTWKNAGGGVEISVPAGARSANSPVWVIRASQP